MKRRAFTLIEMLVAIVVLLAVIIATAKIFGVASDVSAAGEATADVTQQGSVLREQMERDLSRISRDGFVAIQCVAVRNDVRRFLTNPPDPTAPLLVAEPPLDLSAQELSDLLAASGGDEGRAYDLARSRYIVRCDQIVFFTNGTEQSARWAGPGDLGSGGGGQRAKCSRIYYGHGVQFPGLTNDPVNGGEDPRALSSNIKPVVTGFIGPVTNDGPHIKPWTYSKGAYLGLAWNTGQVAGAPRIPASQPEARQWVLARRSVLLADDGGSPWYYPEMRDTNWLATVPTPDPSSAPSIFGDRRQVATNFYPMELRNRDWISLSANIVPSQMIQSGWVDIAASDLDAVRRFVSPTLPLAAPFVVWRPAQPPSATDDGAWRVSSLTPPWAGFDPTTANGPLGWPGGSAAPFPTSEAVMAQQRPNMGDPVTNLQGAVGGYSTQRDRILRGCFGTPANGTVPTATGPTAGVAVGLLGWPRAERSVANMNRRTEVATSPVLLSNCSSFRVDWTWAPGVGEAVSATGQYLGLTDRAVITNGTGSSVRITGDFVAETSGFQPWVSVSGIAGNVNPEVGPIPWFGFPDTGSPDGVINPLDAQRLGATLAQTRIAAAIPTNEPPFQAENLHMSVVAKSVEGHLNASPGQHPAVTAPFGTGVPVRVYSAVFGFNSEQPAVDLQGDTYTGLLAQFDGRGSGVRNGALEGSEWRRDDATDPATNPDGISSGEFNELNLNPLEDDTVSRTEYDGKKAVRVLRDDFTPWPTQIRVTATIHDPRLTLGRGREVQFVLEVPNRGSR
jgi:prepilin-type N-terminal cleavage/methylation domain-containing protein